MSAGVAASVCCPPANHRTPASATHLDEIGLNLVVARFSLLDDAAHGSLIKYLPDGHRLAGGGDLEQSRPALFDLGLCRPAFYGASLISLGGRHRPDLRLLALVGVGRVTRGAQLGGALRVSLFACSRPPAPPWQTMCVAQERLWDLANSRAGATVGRLLMVSFCRHLDTHVLFGDDFRFGKFPCRWIAGDVVTKMCQPIFGRAPLLRK